MSDPRNLPTSKSRLKSTEMAADLGNEGISEATEQAGARASDLGWSRPWSSNPMAATDRRRSGGDLIAGEDLMSPASRSVSSSSIDQPRQSATLAAYSRGVGVVASC